MCKGFAAPHFKKKLDNFFNNQIRILAYHRVVDIKSFDNYLFDPDLVSASIDQFDWQIRHVKDNFDPITFSHYLEYLDGRVLLPKRPLIITFDDGFDDNYTNAFPILKKYDVPATFFISTDYIDSNEPFWFDKLFYLINNSNKISRIDAFDIDIHPDKKYESIQAVLKRAKTLPNYIRLNGMQEIIEKTNYHLPVNGHDESRAMSWDQVVDMSHCGMEIGSHSVSHPIFSRLEDNELQMELLESKAVIESRIGKSCDVLAYPVGGKSVCTDKVVRYAQEAGYRLGVSYISGTNLIDTVDHFMMRRLHVERDINNDLFASMLSMPSVFS